MSNIMASPERQLAQEFGADSVYLTDHGQTLHKESPELLDTYLLTAKVVSHTPSVSENGLVSLGTGNFSHVYGLPDTDELCIKLVSPHTQNTHKNPRLKHLPSLLTEARYMNLVADRLSTNPESGVHAPRYYGVVKFDTSTVSLLDRIPQNYVTIKKLWVEAGHNKERETLLKQQSEMAYKRFKHAVGTWLRWGIGDAGSRFRGVNIGNFMVPHDTFTGEEDFYAIDMYGGFKLRQRALGASVIRLAIAS